MASKYTFHFGEREKIVQERRGGESQRHIVLKLLAYMLYYERGPRIEIPVSESRRDYRPDVVAFDAADNITLWVDCGQITLRKVDDLTRQLRTAEIVVIKPTLKEMEGYAQQAAKKVKLIERVCLLGFDHDFVENLIGGLGHNNVLAWSRDDARLCVTLNGIDYVTTVWRWDLTAEARTPAL
jgi:uncharacterized protein YaeQ